MAAGGDFRFLYREAEGVISRGVWARASVLPVGLALVLTFIAWWVAPDKPRDLATESLFDAGVIAVHVYFLAYAFVLLICAVAEYFVCAKRFADRALPPAFAGLPPFALLLAGAANWFQPRSEGAMPVWLMYVFDLAAVAVIVWALVELGFGESRGRSNQTTN